MISSTVGSSLTRVTSSCCRPPLAEIFPLVMRWSPAQSCHIVGNVRAAAIRAASIPRSPSGCIAKRRPSDGVCRRRRLPRRSRPAARRRFPAAEPAPRELARYLTSLHLEDLALACACALGDARGVGSLRARDAARPLPRGGRARSIGRRARAGRLALCRPLRSRSARRGAPVAAAVLSRPQQPRHVAACRARAASCRSRARRAPYRAAAGGIAGARGVRRPAIRTARASSSMLRAGARDGDGAARRRAIACASAATTRSS